MKPNRTEDLALQRDALVTRAQLQRIQIKAAVTQVRRAALAPRGVGALALGLARMAVQSRAADGTRLRPSPWMLSAGSVAFRVLRASPMARWATGAIVIGGAIWWVVKAVQTPDDDQGADSGDAETGG